MKLKKLFFGILAVAGLGLVSCQTEDLQSNEQNQNQAIGFGTYMSKPAATKAGTTGDMTLKTLKTNGFGVFAYYTAQQDWTTAGATTTPNFMYNQKVTNPGTAWTYSPIKYWPNNDQDKVSFFAYAPHVTTPIAGTETSGITAITANNVNGAPKVTYVLSDDASKAVDFLYAEQTTNKTSDLTNNKVASTGKVKFSFKHALSQIAFKVKLAVDAQANNPATETKVFVESVTIKANLHKGGVFDLAACTWDYSSYAAADFTLKTDESNIKTAIKWTDKSSTQTGVTKDPIELLEANNSFIIMPGATTKFTVEIKYHVVTKDTQLNSDYSDITNTISKEVNISLDSSKKYSLTMNLGLKTVVFDAPEVEAWGTEAGSEIKLPEITA